MTAIAKENDNMLIHAADTIITLEPVETLFTPFSCGSRTAAYPYYTALSRGCDIDKPRNLAKSVTVE